MGEHPVDHNSDKTKGNMENLENSLKHLRDQMINIIRQQDYQRVNTQTDNQNVAAASQKNSRPL